MNLWMYDRRWWTSVRFSKPPLWPEASRVVGRQEEQGQGEGCDGQVVWDWGCYIIDILITVKFFATILISTAPCTAPVFLSMGNVGGRPSSVDPPPQSFAGQLRISCGGGGAWGGV